MVGEMRALDEVAIGRVAIERRTGRDQGGHRGTVGHPRLAQRQRAVGGIGIIRVGQGRIVFLPVKDYSSPEISVSLYPFTGPFESARYIAILPSYRKSTRLNSSH